MNTLSDHFKMLLERIEPPEDRTEKAQDMPEMVRDHIKDHEGILTVKPYSLLAGSYARHTAIGDIKDVDIIVFLDPAYISEESDEEPKKPDEILRTLRKVLNDLPDGESVKLRAQRRSIHVHFTNQDFHLDIVPAIAPNGTDKPLLIPDRPRAEWIESHPLGYGELLSQLNSDNQGKVIPLIKLIKHWRDVHMKQRRPKSYWLSCLVYALMEDIETKYKSYAELFSKLIDAIHDKFIYTLNHKKSVPDIADPVLGHNVAWNWEREHFETFMRRVDESRKWAEKALDEEDQEECVELWRKVLGEDFPTTAEVDAWRLAKASIAGNLLVNGTGRISTVQSPNANSISVPRHRFYGGRSRNYYIRGQARTIGQQLLRMKQLFPGFRYRREGGRIPIWLGTLQPTDSSPQYQLRIETRQSKSPRVWVINPAIKEKAPHRYNNGSLCLYYPKDYSWQRQSWVAETIVPWIAEWLLLYEIWLATGKWWGPEAQHNGIKSSIQ